MCVCVCDIIYKYIEFSSYKKRVYLFLLSSVKLPIRVPFMVQCDKYIKMLSDKAFEKLEISSSHKVFNSKSQVCSMPNSNVATRHSRFPEILILKSSKI